MRELLVALVPANERTISDRDLWYITSFVDSTIGLVYSQILLLLVIPGVLMFHYAWGYGRPHYGLYVLTDLSTVMKKLSCGTKWVVRIDERENWYLNSTKTTAEELPAMLRHQLGQSTDCAVYLDVDPSLNYEVAVHVIDSIQTTQSETVVLLTPQTKSDSVIKSGRALKPDKLRYECGVLPRTLASETRLIPST
jgi:hypothetical protein